MDKIKSNWSSIWSAETPIESCENKICRTCCNVKEKLKAYNFMYDASNLFILNMLSHNAELQKRTNEFMLEMEAANKRINQFCYSECVNSTMCKDVQ